jgi:uncharacterized phage-associated protein
MKSYQAKQIASYFIKKSDSESENDLTNLKIQKMLYFAQAEFYKKNNEPLFIDSIEAWELGPVVYNVYQWLRGCGAYTISSFDVEIDYSGITDKIQKFLDEIWEKYSKYSASYLVEKTHDPNGPWHEAYINRPNTVIDPSNLGSVKLHDEW